MRCNRKMEPEQKKQHTEQDAEKLMILPYETRLSIVLRLPTIEDVLALSQVNKEFYNWAEEDFVITRWKRYNICPNDKRRELAEVALFNTFTRTRGVVFYDSEYNPLRYNSKVLRVRPVMNAVNSFLVTLYFAYSPKYMDARSIVHKYTKADFDLNQPITSSKKETITVAIPSRKIMLKLYCELLEANLMTRVSGNRFVRNNINIQGSIIK